MLQLMLLNYAKIICTLSNQSDVISSTFRPGNKHTSEQTAANNEDQRRHKRKTKGKKHISQGKDRKALTSTPEWNDLQ